MAEDEASASHEFLEEEESEFLINHQLYSKELHLRVQSLGGPSPRAKRRLSPEWKEDEE